MQFLNVASRLALEGVWKQNAFQWEAFLGGKNFPKKSLAQSIA